MGGSLYTDFDIDQGQHGGQALTVFVWKNGAPFEDTLNYYTSTAFPLGIDPSNPIALKLTGNISDSMSPSNGSSNDLNLVAMQTLGHSNSSQGLPNSIALPVDSS